jgi:hypothetical protein
MDASCNSAGLSIAERSIIYKRTQNRTTVPRIRHKNSTNNKKQERITNTGAVKSTGRSSMTFASLIPKGNCTLCSSKANISFGILQKSERHRMESLASKTTRATRRCSPLCMNAQLIKTYDFDFVSQEFTALSFSSHFFLHTCSIAVRLAWCGEVTKWL